TLLRYRRANRDLFDSGAYAPVSIDGSRHAHVFAFSRGYAGRQAIVAVPRLLASLLPDTESAPLGERAWGDTALRLPALSADRYHNVLTDRCVAVERHADGAAIRAAHLFETFPIAVLEGR